MLEAVHLILKEMEGCLNTTVHLHVTVFSLEKFSHAFLQNIQQTCWYSQLFWPNHLCRTQTNQERGVKLKYGSHVPQIPKPRNTSIWKSCKTGLEALLSSQQTPKTHVTSHSASSAEMLVHTKGRISDFQWSMIDYCFASAVSGAITKAQEEFQAPSLPAEVEFCVLQWNCLVWKLEEHSPMDVGWNGITTSLHFKVYLDWL